MLKTSVRLLGIVGLLLPCLLAAPEQAAGAQAPVIMIDPGHGGIDPGTQSRDGQVLEKDLNLKISKKLAESLKAEGFRVAMTRESDEDVTKYAPTNRGWGRHRRDLFGRLEAAHQHRASLLISIHGNHGTPRNEGAVVYHQPFSFESYMLACQLQDSMNRLSGKRFCPRSGGTYYVLRKSEIPSVIVEYGYLSNPSEVSRLLNDAYQDKVVSSLKAGIRQFMVLYGASTK
ncbi:N-acetylmuramoyl-L-alanine amidase family protein [Effusibacillus lacus]|uniref:N-acetylmuramoyl-L-alanine amidase family protein n=1 Tax=Effusibacillus lacus TaxID=1348429 RepID=UPI000BB69CB5|nr:N-acetylmuramoyl-L-alanine amidase [Effusibacillus lacus]TCS72546.1 N-acetylmuramoyl-L-alanine amidase [Effusibacillus lacus]